MPYFKLECVFHLKFIYNFPVRKNRWHGPVDRDRETKGKTDG
jgi:hypothetical protein